MWESKEEACFPQSLKVRDSLFREGSENLLHHGEVLPVVVRLEEGEAEVQLEHDAPHAPNITGLGPAVLCNMEWISYTDHCFHIVVFLINKLDTN